MNPSGPHAGATACTLPVIPYASDTQIPGPHDPVTWKAPKPKHRTPDKSKCIPKILGRSKAGFPVLGSLNNSRSQYTQCHTEAKNKSPERPI